ncbi:hypothetical protein [Pseudomonas sp. Gutcm_11s]|uniref:hypothetical protein n=1 Tax=Pseudomonas sp. Gutcm_11s TaxID=3026088 RepID=UPI002362F6BB|nr:hypothetical protein [Pseudomonas sp. Gutcm_11s]MDD0843938.1 hypothetical protein [Pseudomonas sp. Gutcm_11s]
MTRRHPVPATHVPAAGQCATGYQLNSDKLKVATYLVEKDGERVTIVSEDSAP